ncbi:hypothetical protein Scep_019793 [Stephania cephalantha]|uniref:Uncharacterized protein n=1 Tax=Stephania cephalantha TaxID=152367 RepID=A0AAP0IBH0_9MAGN
MDRKDVNVTITGKGTVLAIMEIFALISIFFISWLLSRRALSSLDNLSAVNTKKRRNVWCPPPLLRAPRHSNASSLITRHHSFVLPAATSLASLRAPLPQVRSPPCSAARPPSSAAATSSAFPRLVPLLLTWLGWRKLEDNKELKIHMVSRHSSKKEIGMNPTINEVGESLKTTKKQSGIRGKDNKEDTLKHLRGANVWFFDVTKIDSLDNSLESIGSLIDVVVSCLASRSGGIKDSWKIDYEAMAKNKTSISMASSNASKSSTAGKTKNNYMKCE